MSIENWAIEMLIALAAIIGAVNIWVRQERAAMTPEQRRAHDEEIKGEMQIW